MYYTNNKSEGFVSFDKCYEHWLDETQKDENKLTEDIFKVDIGELKSHLPEKLVKGDHNIREDTLFILKHFDEIEMYEALEDEYKCSGMCDSALFYFSRPLHEGPPQERCLFKFKHMLHQSADALALNAILTGVLSLFIFFAHFTLYCRPLPPPTRSEY